MKRAFEEVASGWLLLAEQMEWIDRQGPALRSLPDKSSSERSVILILYHVAFIIAASIADYLIGLIVEREFGSHASLIKDTADHDALGKHVKVVIIPLGRWARSRRALED